MKHRLFTILSALSLLPFVAVVVQWARSYFVTDAFIWHFFETICSPSWCKAL